MIIKKMLCKNFYNGRNGHKPEAVVIHISAGSLTSMDNWFQTPGSGASSHYGIGKEGSIHQYVEEINGAWTNGLRWINGVAYDSKGRAVNPTAKIVLAKAGVNPNYYTITIENEGLDLSNHTEIQLKTLIELIRDICGRYNILMDRDHILGHFEIDPLNRPFCPSPDHSIMDEIVSLCNTQQEQMVAVPKRLLLELKNYI